MKRKEWTAASIPVLLLFFHQCKLMNVYVCVSAYVKKEAVLRQSDEKEWVKRWPVFLLRLLFTLVLNKETLERMNEKSMNFFSSFLFSSSLLHFRWQTTMLKRSFHRHPLVHSLYEVVVSSSNFHIEKCLFSFISFLQFHSSFFRLRSPRVLHLSIIQVTVRHQPMNKRQAIRLRKKPLTKTRTRTMKTNEVCEQGSAKRKNRKKREERKKICFCNWMVVRHQSYNNICSHLRKPKMKTNKWSGREKKNFLSLFIFSSLSSLGFFQTATTTMPMRLSREVICE